MERLIDIEHNIDQMIEQEHDVDPIEEPLAVRLQASRVHQEEFNPKQVVIEQGYMHEQLYFVSSDKTMVAGGLISDVLTRHKSFGEISVLKNVQQPYTVKVLDQPCTLLWMDKKIFTNIMKNYKDIGNRVYRNLAEITKTDIHERNKSPQEIIKDDLKHALNVNQRRSHVEVEVRLILELLM
ncbi:hypothetical protein L2E82_43517 [Cichorium intybus]|uniref:Uncharacterized protein n=1 Tax=Cichorium intybus TaxID=13427 RepID=A0ACB8ZNW2_CICIN|nr:hypothetical protein L2E82_43517 [Cichorium intybus]